MPTEWQYHGDGVKSGVTTTHDLDGRLKDVRLQLDCFKVREWTEEELDEHHGSPHVSYDEEKDVFVQHADGAHATLRFGVTDGIAGLRSIEPEDGDRVRPDHMPLLRAAERVLEQIDGIEAVEDPMFTLEETYEVAHSIHIDKLDG